MTTLTGEVALDTAEYLRSWLGFRRRYLRLPGLQVAVLHGDDLVLSVAFGHADLERGHQLTTEHVFRVASHSKTFTATALLQLAQEGRLRLDDEISRWLPFVGEASHRLGRLTVRDLLQHSGGLTRDGVDADFWQLQRPFPDDAALRAVVSEGADDAGVLPPNERFKYSNIGYSLLGLVVEAVSGLRYADYVTSGIIERIGLEHTSPEMGPSSGRLYAVGYSGLAYADERLPIAPLSTGAMAAATGFASTAEDLCRYAAAHFPGDARLLDDSSKRLMQHQWWDVEGPSDAGYGLGWSISTVGDRRTVGHGGAFPGQATHTVFDPVDRLAVAVCTNAIDGPAAALAQTIVKLLDLAAAGARAGGEPGAAPATPEARRFTGRFANLWGVVDVACLGGRLVLLDPTLDDPTGAGTYSALEVVDDHVLRVVSGPGYGAVGEQMRFAIADDGTISSLRNAGGLTMWPIAQYQPGPWPHQQPPGARAQPAPI